LQPSGAHDDQAGIDFFGNSNDDVFGIPLPQHGGNATGVEVEMTNGIGEGAAASFPLARHFLGRDLGRDDVEDGNGGPLNQRNLHQHLHHGFGVASARIRQQDFFYHGDLLEWACNHS
jgi:hypothetical protein